MDLDVVLDAHLDLGEGPIWDAARGRLVFVDINRGHIHEFDPVARLDRIVEVGQPVGAVALSVRGDWTIAARDGFFRVDPDSGSTSLIAEVEADRTDTRMNDGYVDARGRLWAGTMSLVGGSGQGTLYRLDPDGHVEPMLAPVTTSNGIDWSLDGRLMYYVDTRTGRVDVFDFDEARGAISNRREFVTIARETGRPDGLVVDAEGALWVALWAGGALHRYMPNGALERVIRFPVTLTTKCAFGGPDLDDLYVTTASGQLTGAERAAQPLAGALFRVRPGVRGRAPHRFGVGP
jgi:sugar lactone lactonase YvrE